MDPAEWEQRADQIAAELGESVSHIEDEFWPEPPGGSFRQFWPRVKELNEQVRTAPAIKLDDKLQLQHRLNELCHRARLDQKRLQDERDAAERELRDAMDLARENLSESTTVDQVKEAR